MIADGQVVDMNLFKKEHYARSLTKTWNIQSGDEEPFYIEDYRVNTAEIIC